MRRFSAVLFVVVLSLCCLGGCWPDYWEAAIHIENLPQDQYKAATTVVDELVRQANLHTGASDRSKLKADLQLFAEACADTALKNYIMTKAATIN